MMAANTATKTPDIDADLLADAMEKLGQVESALDDALPLDELHEMRQRDIDQSVLWMLTGLSSDLLHDMRTLARLALSLRSLVNGGFSPEEIRIANAFNFDV